MLEGISASFIAAILYDAAKGIYRRFNTPFINALNDTSVYFSKERDIEFNVDGLKTFDSLRHRDNDERLLVNLAVAFLKWLWLENIPDEYKEQWTDIILNVVTANRNKRRLINQIMNRKREIFSPLVYHIEQKFDFVMRTWIAAQRLI